MILHKLGDKLDCRSWETSAELGSPCIGHENEMRRRKKVRVRLINTAHIRSYDNENVRPVSKDNSTEDGPCSYRSHGPAMGA